MVTIILDPKFGIKKEALQEKLGLQNIATRPFFHPLSSLPAYQNLPQAGHAHERNEVSYALSPYGVNLPSALNLTESQVDFVCQSVKQIIQG
jgi:perosamine synthetase